MKTLSTSLFLSLFFISSLSARENVNQPVKTNPVNLQTLAGCAASTSSKDLDIGNVRATIWINGDMWWDLVGSSKYEVPKGSGKHSLFAGAMWIGGRDISGQLKIAAQTYRQSGSDFWPGPLDTNSAGISSSVCLQYDRHWRVTRQEVADFISSGTLTPDIQNWPGNGNTALGQEHYLAPFVDVNADGVYNALDGDYPAYDFSASPNCCDNLHGDQTIWWVFNDKGNIHTESNGAAIGIEIHAQAFAFNSSISNLDNATFYQYKIINRSSIQVDSTYYGQWIDPDLGNYLDDYVGCDVGRGMGYCYNGDANDDGVDGYGLNPPAVGIDILHGPQADVGDGIDNDRDGCLDCTFQLNTITGLIDTIPDYILRETFKMSKFVYYNNDLSVTGNPVTAADYYNYLHGIWKDGNGITYGGNGHGAGTGATNVACDFMFPGISDPLGWGTEMIPQAPWDEAIAGNAPGDRRFLMSDGAFTLLPGGVHCITTTAIWARASTGGPTASVALLQQADDEIQQYFNSCFSSYPLSVNDPQLISNSVKVYPNPFHDYTIMSLPSVKQNTFEITIYNVLGKTVRSIKNISSGNFILMRNELPAGTYFYKISTGGTEIKSGKLIMI
jgi:hypothetical protein